MSKQRDNPLQLDPRYLEGIALFNSQNYFEAHEIWEELWHDCPSAQRRFVQSLIQAAVALYHGTRGNAEGARRLFQRGLEKSGEYPTCYHGLNLPDFWSQVRLALSHCWEAGSRPTGTVPRISLSHPSIEPG